MKTKEINLKIMEVEDQLRKLRKELLKSDKPELKMGQKWITGTKCRVMIVGEQGDSLDGEFITVVMLMSRPNHLEVGTLIVWDRKSFLDYCKLEDNG